MDIVANHTAWDSVLMEHPEFYKQDATGRSFRRWRSGRTWRD